MSSEQRQTDDFKKLFDANQMPELPINLEEKVMVGIEIDKLRQKRSTPNWLNTNLVIFSLSLVFLVVLFVFQYSTQSQVPMLEDIKLLLLSSTGIFFILWAIESAEGVLQSLYSRKLQSSFN